MRLRWLGAWAGVLFAVCVAPVVLADGAGKPPPAPRAEEPERAEEPGMDQRAKFEERMRVLRKKGGDGDFSGFENDALEEAAERRDQAIRAGAQDQHLGLLDPLEEEMFQDSLNEMGIWGGTGCFARPPDLSHQDDLALYKTLSKEDFQEKRPDRTRAPGKEAIRLHAYVFVVISCAVNAQVERTPEDQWIARAKRAAYFPMISRMRSWWNPRSRRAKADVLAHEQLHVELARMVSEDLTEKFEQGRVVVRGEGRSEEAAIALFQVRWGNHIREARDELRRLERAYDRETDFGNDTSRQAAWQTRIGDGLGAVRAVAPPSAE